MVLFKEDEQRIKEMERQERLARRTPLGRWARRLAKIFLLLAVFAFFGLTLLRGLSGNNEALKNGIEDYISQSTGLVAEIDEFNYMGFFPDLKLDAGQIKLSGQKGGAPLVTVGKADFVAGFFDLMFSRRRIKALDFENITIDPALAGGRMLTLSRVALEQDAGNGKAGLVVAGQWGEDKLNAQLAMTYITGEGDPAYTLPEKSAFTLALGLLSGNGYIAKAGPLGGIAFHFAAIGTENAKLAGTVVLEKRLFGSRVDADITFGGSRFTLGAKRLDGGLAGKAGFPVIHRDDLAILKDLYDFILARLPQPEPDKPIDLYGQEYDLSLFADEIFDGPVSLGHISLPLAIRDQILRAGPLTGKFSGGTLSGAFTLDASVLPADAEAHFSLEDAEYTVLGGPGGPVALSAQAQGKGRSVPVLLHALEGGLQVVGGEGEIPARALYDLLGAGDKVPETRKLQVDCLLGDFTLANGVLKPVPLLVDTADGLLLGTGSAAIAGGGGKLSLEPGDRAADIVFPDRKKLAALSPEAARACGEYLTPTESK